MKYEVYNTRVWLNPSNSSSSSSVVCFDGPAQWGDGDIPYAAMFVEISDCHGKIRIHQSKFETREEFTKKVRLLRDTISDFLKYLDNEKEDDKQECDRFVVSDGTIIDKKSGLEWRVRSGKSVTFFGAKMWVDNISGEGWRMPTVKELESLYQNNGTEKNNIHPYFGEVLFAWSVEEKDDSAVYVFNFEKGRPGFGCRAYENYSSAFAVRERKC